MNDFNGFEGKKRVTLITKHVLLIRMQFSPDESTMMKVCFYFSICSKFSNSSNKMRTPITVFLNPHVIRYITEL